MKEGKVTKILKMGNKELNCDSCHFGSFFAHCVLRWIGLSGNWGVRELLRELISFWEPFCPLCFEVGWGMS